MGCSRREFVRRSLGCAGYLVAALPLVPGGVRKAFAATSRGKVVAQEKFGRIEEIAEGAWALISTPFAEGGPHFETVANGGIVAGRDGVLIVEALYTDEGAAWFARQARELLRSVPTLEHVATYDMTYELDSKREFDDNQLDCVLILRRRTDG